MQVSNKKLMKNDPGKFKLPLKRKGIAPVEYLYRVSALRLVLFGILAYFLIACLFSVIEYVLKSPLTYFKGTPGPLSFWDLIYFNFTTILTVGYGDYSPSGYVRILSIIEAFIGVGLYSFFVAVLTVKSLFPKKHSIVFSKYGYYSLAEKKFLIIFLNTAKENIANAEICSYFKLGADWEILPSGKTPFITKSVQTFFVTNEYAPEELKEKLHPYDCLRVGISGGIGMANYSTSVEYGTDDIIVIESREVLRKYEGFWKVDERIKSSEFKNHFHYRPAGSNSLKEYFGK